MKKIKKVLYLLRDKLENLPPSMSQISALCQNGYEVTVVTMQASDYICEFYKDFDVEFITLKENKKCKIVVLNKIIKLLAYRSLVKKTLKTHQYDLLWVGSADTARYCRDFIAGHHSMVLNIYELYDKTPKLIHAITPIARAAKSVIVPEYNRAHILKVWLGLKETPVIIPNKPCFPDVSILPETQAVVDKLKALNKKIVLYQGWIGKDRDVSQIAQALNKVKNKEDYVLVLMGSVTSSDTISVLQKSFAMTLHIPFLQPPQHLFVTETAHMGIATYDDSSLNNIFCAPNKIYEYAQKKVPILARDIPGLSSTVGKFQAGVCVDMNDTDALAKAIEQISENHDRYVASLEQFTKEYDVAKIIMDIIKKCEENSEV